MKKCPQCGRGYNDDSLSFCLDDGSELLFGPALDEPATAILHATSASSESATRAQAHTTEQTAVFPVGRTAVPKAKEFDRRLLLVPLALALLFLGGLFAYRYFAPATGHIDSIAVMPFVNENGSGDLDYLSDGMTEVLISSLTKLPNLNVKSRSSVFRYKGRETDA
jgi:hypothetical protein